MTGINGVTTDAKPRLWVCERCKMIGEADEAEGHVELKGHRVKQLSQDVSDGVRAEWARTNDPRFER